MGASTFIGIGGAVVVSLAVAACGGSHGHGHGHVNGNANGNGIAARPPDAIVTAATRAIDGVRSVRVSGVIPGPGTSIRLDLQLLNGRGAIGSMSENGLPFRLIVVGDTTYIDGSTGFWRSFGGAAAAARLRGRWLRAPAGSGALASLTPVTDVRRLMTALLSHHGVLVKAGRSTVDGHPVLALRDASHGGILDVATSGPPYPIRISGTSNGGAGQLDFGDFDASVALAPPATSVAIPSLTR